MLMDNKKVCVIGLWHLGLVSAAGLADMGYRVSALDSRPGIINEIQQGRLPIFEPGLDDLVEKQRHAGNLFFEADPAVALAGAEIVLIAYDTPVDDNDQVDLTIVEKTISAAAPYLAAHALVIINSQIPVGTTEKWQTVIENKRPGAEIDLVCSPENIRLGQALELFRKPDMIVIGSDSERARDKAEKFFSAFACEKFHVSCRTAEMTKHALNVFFATCISFANELGNLCDAVGADGMQIAKILKQDSRIGKKAQVRPGLGFAGATLARDLRALQSLGKKTGVPTPLAETVLEINHRQTDRVAHMVENYFEGNLRDKNLAVYGLTYKPGTSTLRRSAAIEIIRELHKRGAKITAHDPKADLSEYDGDRIFEFCRDPYRAAENSSAILLMTEWPEYREIDFERIKKTMAHPMILDAKNFLDGDKLRAAGYTYLEIGRGQLARAKS